MEPIYCGYIMDKSMRYTENKLVYNIYTVIFAVKMFYFALN